MTSVLRFAPSPNGPLHMGHALSALTGYEMAKSCEGRFLLRIEDIDVARTRETHVEGIFRDLSWLGVHWEKPVWRQSTRFGAYRDAANRLRDAGLLYACFANRSQINAMADRVNCRRDPDGAPLFDGELRSKVEREASSRFARGEPHAQRLDMARAMALASQRLGAAQLTATHILPSGRVETKPASPQLWGDAVMVRKDTPASYHLAVVVDDAAQGVTHVTRGQDLLAATDLHRLLQVLLELPEPTYHHHTLIVRPDGQKLSKSAGDLSLAELRASGLTAEAVKSAIRVAPPRIATSTQYGHFHLK